MCGNLAAVMQQASRQSGGEGQQCCGADDCAVAVATHGVRARLVGALGGGCIQHHIGGERRADLQRSSRDARLGRRLRSGGGAGKAGLFCMRGAVSTAAVGLTSCALRPPSMPCCLAPRTR